MRKTVCSVYRGAVRSELVFDDWTWEHVESVDEEGIWESRNLSIDQTIEIFEDHFKTSHDEPLELVFQRHFPTPFLVYNQNQPIQFDPKGWSLFASATFERDTYWDGFDWYGYSWLFGAADNWIKVTAEYHSASEGRPMNPTIEYLNNREAADFLVSNGYRLPSTLKGSESIKVLTPQNAADLFCDSNTTDKLRAANDAGSESAHEENVNDCLSVEMRISDIAVESQEIAEKFYHFADEFRALRLISASDEQERQMNDVLTRCGEAIQIAMRSKILPSSILDNANAKPKRFNIFQDFWSAVSMLGYWTPTFMQTIVTVTPEGEDVYGDGDDVLVPGFVSSAWPQRFDEILCGQRKDGEDDSAFAKRCRDENRFAILGRYAHECESLGDWIRSTTKNEDHHNGNAEQQPKDTPEDRRETAQGMNAGPGQLLWDHISANHSPGVEPYRLAKLVKNGNCDYQKVCDELVPGKVSQSEKTKRFHAVADRVNRSLERSGVKCHVIRDPSNRNRVIVVSGFKNSARKESR